MITAKGKQTPNPFEDDGVELIFIDPKEHVFTGEQVIGPAKLEFYQDAVLKSLVAQAIKQIKPQIIEKNGYELVRYKLIIKEYTK